MNHSKVSEAKESKIDGMSIMRFVLGYEDYWRLMGMLFLCGLLAGVTYFIYARATFESHSLIRVNLFVDAEEAARGERTQGVSGRMLRALTQQLSSATYILEAAKSIGAADESTSISDFRASALPALRIGVLDINHLEIGVSSFDPQLVEKMPVALVESYERIRSKLRLEYREKAIARYKEELAEIRRRVTEQLESRLKYEEESSLADAQIELERLSNLPVQLIQARYQLKEFERAEKLLSDQEQSFDLIERLSLLTSATATRKDPLDAGRIVRRSANVRNGPITFQNPERGKISAEVVVRPDMVEGLEPWREVEKKMRSLDEEIRRNESRYLDDHPEMIRLHNDLKAAKAALEVEVNVAEKAFELERDRLIQEIKTLEEKLPEYYRVNKTYDEKKLEYDLMEKSQLAWDRAYEKLAKQIDGLSFDAEGQSINLEFRGFTDLKNRAPVSPNKLKLLSMGFMLGLGLAGGIPFLLRRFDSSVTELNELEKTLGISGIGLIPLEDPAELEAISRAPTVGATIPNALLENFRLIRSSILLNQGEKRDSRVVMITSARPSEGKTTVAANVAWAFASMGEKTVLIDCDLRRGRVYQVTGIQNAPGLTDLLTGSADLENCLNKVDSENLWVIPRGPIRVGTTELLNTEVFANLLGKLSERFDRIILDTPPVLGLSETAFLQQYANGVLLVTRCGVTLRKDIEDAVTLMRKLGTHFYGFVLNMVDFTKRQNQYSYYYYSASYYEDNWSSDEEDAKALAKK